jgi:hypothetical protein
MKGVERVYPDTDKPSSDGLSDELLDLETKLESVKVVPLLQGEVKVTSIEAEKEILREQLIAKHPNPEILNTKFTETVRLFDKLESDGKLLTGYEAPEGPTIALTNISAGMQRLEELKRIDPERFSQSRATLAETAFVKLFVDKNSAAAIAGEAESLLTLDILALDAEKHIAERR